MRRKNSVCWHFYHFVPVALVLTLAVNHLSSRFMDISSFQDAGSSIQEKVDITADDSVGGIRMNGEEHHGTMFEDIRMKSEVNTDLKSMFPKKSVLTLEDDYCSSGGSVCAYHNICYDTASGSWHTSANPMTDFPLLNDSNFRKKSDNPREAAAGCSESFAPESNIQSPSAEEMIYVKGTSYLVCCWVNHFGHILLQMMSSAVHALQKIGLKRRFRANTITFLVDNKASSYGSKDTILNVLEFLTKNSNRVSVLQHLEEKAKEDGKDKVCFEKLVVGMLHDDLVHGGPHKTHPPQASTNMLLPIREHLEEMYPLTEKSISSAVKDTQVSQTIPGSSNLKVTQPECTVTILRRNGDTRVMGNFDNVMDVAKEVFYESKWNIRTVSFDGPSLESQYLTVRSSMVLVSVSGTGSHMAMFLNEGGISVEIQYNINDRMKNRHICHVSPNLSCLAVNSTCNDDFELGCKNADFIYIDLESFKQTIEDVKKEISNKCDGAQRSLP